MDWCRLITDPFIRPQVVDGDLRVVPALPLVARHAPLRPRVTVASPGEDLQLPHVVSVHAVPKLHAHLPGTTEGRDEDAVQRKDGNLGNSAYYDVFKHE